MSATATADDLRMARLFRDLPQAALDELAAQSRLLELRAGEKLFAQDDASDALYILQEGQIHVLRQHPTGEEVVLATEVPYYVIGEISALAGERRSGAVAAVTDSVLVAINRAAVFDVCNRFPDVAASLITYLSGRLYRMNLLVREYAIGNVAARVASALLLSGGQT
ncbi:MAG: Crp/Fnr family transcriptional regulator, partial [Anaerolineae bacterium]|nr:Crp/Fnr family transcriptional regulator [Anaerolineae bacterium]